MPRKGEGRITGRPVTKTIPQPAGGVRMETFVPWTLVKRGTKKQVSIPLDAPAQVLGEAEMANPVRLAEQARPLVKALGLAHYWQCLLDEGKAATIAEIAAAEGLDKAYVSHLCRLLNLAPDLIESCLLGGKAVPMLDRLVRHGVPRAWDQQSKRRPP